MVLGAIPLIELGVWRPEVFGLSIPVDPWATLVCIGFVAGLEVARNRAIKMGLDVRDVVDGAVFIVLMGFLVGHIVTVVAYHPERLAEEPIMAILRVWEGFSSFGGFLGAVIGSALFYNVVRKRPAWRHIDTIAFGFPVGWFFGRVGCGVVHDHVGAPTDFPLGMYFPKGHWAAQEAAMVRHELGLYEAAFMIPVIALFLYLGRRDRVPGFFAGLFAVLYAPVRFFLDFLRNTDLSGADARYAGLTPAQYGALVMLIAGIALLATRDYKGFEPHPLDGSRGPEPDTGPEGG